MSVHILILDAEKADESILQEIVSLLSQRTDVQVIESSWGGTYSNNHKQEVLSFPDLEIHIKVIHSPNRVLRLPFLLLLIAL